MVTTKLRDLRKGSKGFTLIELLVVIAIIGLLAAVILASLGGARSKGGNAAIKSTLDGIRSQAELYAADNSNSYSGVCDDPQVKKELDGVKNDNGGTAAICQASATAWAVSAVLSAPEGPAGSTYSHWCVDSASGAVGTNADVSTTNC